MAGHFAGVSATTPTALRAQGLICRPGLLCCGTPTLHIRPRVLGLICKLVYRPVADPILESMCAIPAADERACGWMLQCISFPALPPQSGRGGAALLPAHARMPSDKWNRCIYHWLPKSALRVMRIDGMATRRKGCNFSKSNIVSDDVLFAALVAILYLLTRLYCTWPVLNHVPGFASRGVASRSVFASPAACSC